MSGHLLLFGQDITRPTPAIHHGNGQPYGEIQFPGGVITYRDVADVDEAIAAHAELRRMLAAAQARDVVVPMEDAIGGRVLGVETTDTGLTVTVELPEPDLEPLPPLPQRTPAKVVACPVCNAPPGDDCLNTVTDEPIRGTVHGGRVTKWEQQSQPGGTTYPGLTPEALKREAPLATLAPDGDDTEDEAEQ